MTQAELGDHALAASTRRGMRSAAWHRLRSPRPRIRSSSKIAATSPTIGLSLEPHRGNWVRRASAPPDHSGSCRDHTDASDGQGWSLKIAPCNVGNQDNATHGHALAIRNCDVDATSSPRRPSVYAGTIVSPAGKPTHRQPHPKTARSTRTVSIPSFAAQAAARAAGESGVRATAAPALLHLQWHTADHKQRAAAASEHHGRGRHPGASLRTRSKWLRTDLWAPSDRDDDLAADASSFEPANRIRHLRERV
jgi:hypothetical protein